MLQDTWSNETQMNQGMRGADFVTLVCPSCGGKLQIAKGIDRFACSYCGSGHLVRREGGLVYLAPIAEDIHHIRGGVDKTAAELAVARLRQDIRELEYTYQELSNRNDADWMSLVPAEKRIFAIVFAVSLLLIMSRLTYLGPLGLFIFFGGVIAAIVFSVRRKFLIADMKMRRLSRLQDTIYDKQRLQRKNELIVDG